MKTSHSKGNRLTHEHGHVRIIWPLSTYCVGNAAPALSTRRPLSDVQKVIGAISGIIFFYMNCFESHWLRWSGLDPLIFGLLQVGVWGASRSVAVLELVQQPSFSWQVLLAHLLTLFVSRARSVARPCLPFCTLNASTKKIFFSKNWAVLVSGALPSWVLHLEAHTFWEQSRRRIRRILCSSARCRVVADKIIHELALLGQYVSTIQTRSNLARNGPEEEKGCIRWAAEAEEKRLLICIFSNCTLPSHDQASLLLSQLIVTKR
jgi:hypothetical protein